MECIKYIHMNGLKTYFHDHSENNKVFLSTFLWNCVSCLLPLKFEKYSRLTYIFNIAWIELFEKKIKKNRKNLVLFKSFLYLFNIYNYGKIYSSNFQYENIWNIITGKVSERKKP